MAFQPIVNLATGSTYAQEALARGLAGEPAHTVLSQVTAQNRYGFDQACRTLAIEQATSFGILETDALLSINFMPNAVYEPMACIRQTMVAARKASLPPARIIFEFTETEKLEAPHLQRILSAYREIGFLTAIDDFGSGYSGLGLLSKMQPDIVKIDIDLIRNIDAEPVKRRMLTHIVAMLTDLGITIVCEGVETQAELAVIRDLGVDLVQGYLVAKPAFEALLQPDIAGLGEGRD